MGTLKQTTSLATKWNDYSLAFQLGNLGSEVSRALRSKGKDEARYIPACERMMTLMNLTICDAKNQAMPRLKELCRLQETLTDYFFGNNIYKSSKELWESYFLAWGVKANHERRSR